VEKQMGIAAGRKNGASCEQPSEQYCAKTLPDDKTARCIRPTSLGILHPVTKSGTRGGGVRGRRKRRFFVTVDFGAQVIANGVFQSAQEICHE